VSEDAIAIRQLDTVEEFQRAEEIQREIWNMPGEIDVVPLHLLVTAQKNGGLVLGAFHGAHMIGLLFGFLGRGRDGSSKHCSHMMGVLPAYRGRGIGERLKRWQREFVAAQEIELITWTYDPLESANATLNLHKLGATCRTYLRNIYGDLRDALNRGLPTDRFEVEWRAVQGPSERHAWTAGLAPGRIPHDLPPGLRLATDVSFNPAGLPELEGWKQEQAPAALVEVPARFQHVKTIDMSLAQRWRFGTRDIFETYFAAGYAAVDVVNIGAGSERRCFYILEHQEEADAS